MRRDRVPAAVLMLSQAQARRAVQLLRELRDRGELCDTPLAVRVESFLRGLERRGRS